MTTVTAPPAVRYDEPAVRRTDLAEGVRTMASLLVTFVPFALMVGAAIHTSANPVAAWLGTWGVYGGAAQLALLQALAQGSGWAGAAVVGLLVNLRLAAYAAAMVPDWRDAPARFRVAAGIVLTDLPWALAGARPHGRRGFYLGAGLTLYLAFPLMVTLGTYAGARLGTVPLAELLPTISIGVLVAGRLRERAVALAVTVAAVLAFATARLDGATALLMCAAAGVVAAVLTERRS